jgi:hypothetical protein
MKQKGVIKPFAAGALWRHENGMAKIAGNAA